MNNPPIVLMNRPEFDHTLFGWETSLMSTYPIQFVESNSTTNTPTTNIVSTTTEDDTLPPTDEVHVYDLNMDYDLTDVQPMLVTPTVYGALRLSTTKRLVQGGAGYTIFV